MEDNCYKGKLTKKGIHKDLFFRLYNKNKWAGKLDVKRPENYYEAQMLVSFIMGIDTSITIKDFFDNSSKYDKQKLREIAFLKLEGKDSIPGDRYGNIELGGFRYEISTEVRHDDYCDKEFNRLISPWSSYEMEASIVPISIFHDRGNSGIMYGQPTITSFNELEFMRKFNENKYNPASREYIDYVNYLKSENQKCIESDQYIHSETPENI